MEFFKTEEEFHDWLDELAASVEFNEPPQIEESQLVEDLSENDLFQTDFFNKSFLDAYLENLNFDCDPGTVNLTVNNVELSVPFAETSTCSHVALSVNPVVGDSQPRNSELLVNNVNNPKNPPKIKKERTVRIGTIFPFKKEIFTKRKTIKSKKKRISRIGTIFPFKLEIFTKPKNKKSRKTVKPKPEQKLNVKRNFPISVPQITDSKFTTVAPLTPTNPPFIDPLTNNADPKLSTSKVDDIYCGDELITGAGTKQNLKYIDIQTHNKSYLKTYTRHVISYQIMLKKDLPKINKNNLITLALDEMIEYCKSETNFVEGDQMDIVVENEYFHNKAISTGYQRQNIGKHLRDKIIQITTSDQKVILEDCIFTIKVINIPRGEGRSRVIDLEEDPITKRSIRQIHNNDNRCGIYAALVGKSYHTNTILDDPLSDNEIKYLRMGRNIMYELGSELVTRLSDKIDVDNTGLTLSLIHI